MKYPIDTMFKTIGGNILQVINFNEQTKLYSVVITKDSTSIDATISQHALENLILVNDHKE